MDSYLTFERKFIDLDSSRRRSYIDFIIDGKPLSQLLNGVSINIGKFGWKTNLQFEIEQFKEFRNGYKSKQENGLFSIYVCPDCGDEECGAVMMRIAHDKNKVIWTDFVWSNGLVKSKEDPDEKINIEPLIFDRDKYFHALARLQKMISEK